VLIENGLTVVALHVSLALKNLSEGNAADQKLLRLFSMSIYVYN
jgi:hypothetical protein